MTSRLRRVLNASAASRMALSLVIALIVWGWVTKQTDPDTTYHADNIQVTATGVPDGVQVIGTLPTVTVTLKGPRSVTRRITADSIAATVDLSGVSGPGVYMRKIKISTADGLRSKVASPDTATVVLDSVTSKTFKVEVQPPQNVGRGLTVSSAIAAPEDVTVTGVQQDVNRVAHVIVNVNLANRQESFSADVAPQPVDANFAPIANLTVSPATVNLSVAVQVRGKDIPVFVRSSGNAANGYQIVGEPTALPATVLVDGPSDALAKVQYIYTTPVDTSTLTAPTVLNNIPLDTSELPAGVSLDTQTVDVQVRVEQTDTPRTFDGVPVSVINLAPGLQSSVNPATVSITITGAPDDVNALTAGEISVVVSAANLGPGTFSVVPRVSLPPHLSYDPLSQVTVTITAVPPTPTPTPPPAPTAAPGPTATAAP